ncbi:porin family protein [Coprobacter tertius]|uniref:PorT family protein n=1 Tax=Coprobacter tertius TaxID=2944915 RepID=A0ABT1MGZ7_9BACT|nr:porin family protein [Coprobacter tertius]MCP9611910.1 PorT family protein [Coprobacter tertius]
MKRKFLLLFAVLFLSAAAVSAQENRMYWGPKIGLNIASITKSSFSSWRGGANVGLFAMYRYNDFWGAEVDLMFSQMGANYADGNMRVNYLTLPIMGKVYLYRNLNLQLGPQIGVKVYDNVHVYGEGNNRDTKAFNSFEVGFVVGLGYEFNFGLVTDIRYGIGFTNSLKNSYAMGDNCKNQMFQLSVGWKF